MRRISLVVMALTIGFLTVSPASAQSADKESITLSPAAASYAIDAGSTKNGKLTIVNDGTTAYDFLVYARPYSIKDNQYDNPDFTTPAKNADLYGWVQFPQTKYHIEPNATQEVPYIVRVPAGAAPGGHYGVVFAETQPVQDQSAGNSVLRKKRVGSIIYATVNGKVTQSGDEVSNSIPFWQFQPPLHTSLATKSTGNTDFVSKVQLTVRDAFGNVKYQANKDYHVLPGTTRTIAMDWDKASWFGLYRVQTQQQFLDKTLTHEGYVLLMPRYVPFIIIVIVLIGGVYALRRRKK